MCEINDPLPESHRRLLECRKKPDAVIISSLGHGNQNFYQAMWGRENTLTKFY